MNASAIKTALRHLAGWGIFVFFVGLLTLIFSFLGSFFCAGLAGMMLGSVKFSRWQVVASSLTAPAVLCAILLIGRTELPARQIRLLSMLGLGIFWVTYLVVRWMVWYERKNQPANTVPPSSRATAPVGMQQLEQQERSAAHAVVTTSVSVRPWGELSLQVLQGKWSCANANGSAHPEQKVMEIDHESLFLSVSDSSGNVSFLGKGKVKLSKDQEGPRLTISEAILESPQDTLVSI